MSDPYSTQQRPDFAAPGQPAPAGPPTQSGPPPMGQSGPPPMGQSGPYPGQPGPYAGPPIQPGSYPRPYVRIVERDARPALLTLSMVLVIAGSLMWITEVGFVWITAISVRNSFGYNGVEGVFYHLLNRFHLRMLEQGLGLVLFGFPTAAIVLGFFLLMRKSWPRIAMTALGAGTVIVTAVLLRDSLAWVIPFAVYIGFSCVILWAPSVTNWCSPKGPDEPVPGRMGA